MGRGTSIGRVRGLGAAHEGTQHWWRQRVTAGSNLFLMAWFMISLAMLPGMDYGTVHSWIQSAWVAVPLVLLVTSICYHARLGLQVVIEDYQHDETRVVGLLLLNFFMAAAYGIAIFAILKIAFGAVA